MKHADFTEAFFANALKHFEVPEGSFEQCTQDDIPGTHYSQIIERDVNGALIRIAINDKTFIERVDGALVFDRGFVSMRNVLVPNGLLRTIKTADDSWQEFYKTCDKKLPVSVDGVSIQRDRHGRVISCDGQNQHWHYQFHEQQLVAIQADKKRRTILRDTQSRPTQYSELEPVHMTRHIQYDVNGQRLGINNLPEEFCVDIEGRLRAIFDKNQQPLYVFLWDGYNCLARIAGDPDTSESRIDTVYSLDMTGTPVRFIERDKVTRIPRDAYGENLLAYQNHPGLFGGTQYKGYVYFRSRTLDNRTASFNAPDPLHGGKDDPRRTAGYSGKLLVETPKAGPYAVCQYDPLTFLDPTGEIAWYYVISTLTWAFPNNILSWIGLEATANFWGTFWTADWENWADAEHWESPRLDIGGVQRQSFFAPNPGGAFTTQHLIWARHEYIDQKRRATVFDPQGEYRPQLYNSMLRIVPADKGAPFLLCGQQTIGGVTQPNNQLWVRSGGPAEEVAPGQRVPRFPQGGLHFPWRDASIPGPQGATCTEVTPTNSTGVGTLDNNTTLELPNTLTLNQGDLLLLEDSANVVELIAVVTTVPNGSNNTVRLAEAPGFSDTTGLTVSQVQASTWNENLSNNGMPAANFLDISTSTNAYQIGDALQLDDSGTLYGAQIERFETQVSLDEALSGTPATPLNIFTLTVNTGASFNAQINSPTELEFLSGTTPSEGDFILVSDGSNSLVVVVGSGSGATRSVDRNMSGLSGPSVTWQTAARGANLGLQNTSITAGQLTYAPASISVIPAANDHLVIDYGPAGAVVTQLRTVTALNHHALVVKNSVPLAPANTTFSVNRHPLGLSFNNRSLDQSLVLALASGNVTNAVALQLYQLPGNTITGTRFIEGNLNLAGSTATRVWYSNRLNLTPNQPVTVRSVGSSAEEALSIAKVTLDLVLNYPLDFGSSTLEVVQMARSGFRYIGRSTSPNQIVVSPLVAGTTVAADMPSFSEGECVEVRDDGTGNILGQYRISLVPEGTVLDLESGPPLPASTVVQIQRLSVTPSGNGASRIAVNGQLQYLDANQSHVLRADVWNRDGFVDNSYVGITDGTRTLPRRVRAVTTSSPVAISGNNQVDITGAAALGGLLSTNDFVRVCWVDAASGDEQTRFFQISNITGSIVDLAPQSSAGATGFAATDTSAVLHAFNTNRLIDATAPAVNQVDLSPQTMGGLALPTVPLFNVNDRLLVSWTDGGRVRAQEFQVNSKAANVLTLTQNSTSPGLDLPSGAANVTVMHLPQLSVVFNSPPTTTGPINLSQLPAGTQSEFVARFTRETEQSLLMPNPGSLASPSDNVVIVIPLQESGSAQNGQLGSGTGKVPEDPENTDHGENDRRQMLVEHELRHTEQYMWWGPMFITLIPLWPVELALELATDIEQPDFGPFQEAQLEAAGAAMKITFASGDGGFAVDQDVQINQGAHNVTTKLRAPADGESGFRIQASGELSAGVVFVRSINSFPDWYRVVHGSWFRTLTIGGLVQLAASLTHGLFFQIVGRFFYMIYRGIQMACCDDRKQGVVEGGRRQVRLSNPAERNDLVNHELLLIQEPQDFGNVVFSGIDTVVRSRVGAISDDGVITLSAPLSWEDGRTVNIGPYQSQTPGQLFDWKTYYPAQVQANNFNRLQILPVGDDTLSLQPFDRLRVIAEGEFYGMFSNVRTVISVNGDMVDVDEPVTGSGSADTQLTVRVAKIGTEEPFDFLDTVGMSELTGNGWLRWVTDPYGQLHSATSPNPGSAEDVFARIGKYMMGTKSWTNPIIITSRYFAEAMTKELYNVSLEQDASEQSGDLYSPIGRIRGEASVNDRNVTMTVGDIARFWYFGYEFSDSQNSMPALGRIGQYRTDPGFRMDEPGLQVLQEQIVYAQQTAESGVGTAFWLNEGAESAALGSSPGLDMADAFWLKQADPNDVSSTAIDRRMLPSNMGLVPQSPNLQLSSAVYLAFTRATSGTTHRATMDDDIPGAGSRGPRTARDAQDNDAQKVFYNITVNDVTVNFNNVAVAEGATITLLKTQQMTVTVSDEGNKQYAVLVMQPDNGDVVTASSTPNKTLSARDPFAGGAGPFSEPFQVCRWHDFNDGSYRSGGLTQHGMHLAQDVFIPVRKLTVNVVDIPPVLTALPASLDFSMYPGVTPLPSLQPGGSLFIPVAANVMTANQTLNYTSPPTPDITEKPNRSLTDVSTTASQQVQDFLGDGLLYQLSMGESDIPEEVSTLELSFTVGDGSLNSNISLTINIDGHFLARDTGALAASGYQISTGNSVDLECVELDGSTAVTPDDSTVQVTLRNGSAAPAGELAFSTSGNLLNVSVNGGADTGVDSGFRRLLIQNSGGTLRAARTIQIV